MARLPRLYVGGMTQHIIVRSKFQNDIFLKEEDFQYYLSCLEDAAVRYRCAIHAYVLMPNHVHILATPETKQSLSRMLQSIGRRYAQYFNQSFDRSGSLWDTRYKATVIDSKQYLLTCMRYIELNPARAKLVKHTKAYPWSSYLHNALGDNNPCLSEHKLYRKLGQSAPARQAAYRSLFKGRLPKADVDAIVEATNKGWALGDEQFREWLQAFTDRRVKPLPKGRPRLHKTSHTQPQQKL